MLYRVFNQGEIPIIGHGWRSIIVLPPGRKWVTLIDWTTLETTRIELTLWKNLHPLPATGLNRRRVHSVMRRRLDYLPATRAIKQALSLLKDATR